MNRNRTACGWALGLAGLFAAVAPEVNDQGKFFSAAAVKKANDRILDIARKFDRDVLVETFEVIPGTPAEKIKEMSVKERDAFFRQWVKKRCEEKAVHGFYVLVTREPKYLYVGQEPAPDKVRPGPHLNEAGVTKVREYLLGQFRDGNFDEGLTGFVQRVEEGLAAGAKQK
jgi:uncharacterized membrane protein YgcG